MTLLLQGLWARLLDWLTDKWRQLRGRNTGDITGFEDTQ